MFALRINKIPETPYDMNFIDFTLGTGTQYTAFIKYSAEQVSRQELKKLYDEQGRTVESLSTF